MFSDFQRRLAISPTSLHTVAVIVVIAWVIGGRANPTTSDSMVGLWALLPDGVIRAGWLNHILAIITAVLVIYIIRELNVSNVLLRLNSRTISFTFAALITSCFFLHGFQPGYLVMLFYTLSLFPLFNAYQQDNSAGNAYITFLYLGLSAIVFPKMIWMTPIYVLSFYILRALNPRSACASFLGLATPFWIVGTIAFCSENMSIFNTILYQMIDFKWGGYTLHSASQTIMIWMAFAIFVLGTVDFYMRIYLDKTRTRVIYNVVILHGAAYFLLLLLQPISSLTLLPVTLVMTALMGGHYISNDDTTLSNILVCLFSVLLIVMFILNTWIL